jgi:diamine N-acetyltransferase
MDTHIQIRKATPGDIGYIKQIADATWAQTYASILSAEQISYMFNLAYTPTALHTQMTTDKHVFLLLFYDHVATAFASYSVLPEANDTIKIHKLYILPQLQGKGLGKLLLDEVSQQATKQKINRLCLNVNRYNNALHFYKRYGFTVSREADIPVGPYWMNDYIMEKCL